MQNQYSHIHTLYRIMYFFGTARSAYLSEILSARIRTHRLSMSLPFLLRNVYGTASKNITLTDFPSELQRISMHFHRIFITI